MIQLNIRTQTEESASKMVAYLLDQKLVYDPTISNSRAYTKTIKSDRLISKESWLITAKTKALLFTRIKRDLHDKFPKSSPIIYGLPIVYMSAEHTKKLLGSTIEV